MQNLTQTIDDQASKTQIFWFFNLLTQCICTLIYVKVQHNAICCSANKVFYANWVWLHWQILATRTGSCKWNPLLINRYTFWPSLRPAAF
uniref:Uncharacterized protein n=1 Tax=Gasterosteus aculeatus TaxID=69293 RepID=G3P814_GASAC